MKLLVQDEIKTIMSGVVDRALHDFRGHKLPERFREFNKEKEEGRSIGILNALADRETRCRISLFTAAGEAAAAAAAGRESHVWPG